MTRFHFGDMPAAKPGERHIEVPVKIESKQELLKFLAEAFPLPAYFGHNWDALEECLTDMEWLGNGKTVALVHGDVPLKATEEQTIYLLILAKAPDCLRVAFPDRCRVEVAKLLSSA